ncbi:MAG: hypothetical protein J2P50_18170 [Hyphomicrobiaceae bacterium]|nr:hypothetical protein [Hyphomicrobiaceae bacterium]
MRSVGVLVLVAIAWLPNCKGEGAPGSFDKFLPPFPPPATGPRLEEMCSAANDGKRFWLEGYMQLPTNITIRGSKTGLDFYAQIDSDGRGAGRSLRVDVTSPGDIEDLWASATGKKGIAIRTGKIDPDALRIKAGDGVATPRDKIKLSFDMTAIKQPQTGEVTACRYDFARAAKI